MKTAEELNALKEEIATLNRKLTDLTEEDWIQPHALHHMQLPDAFPSLADFGYAPTSTRKNPRFV